MVCYGCGHTRMRHQSIAAAVILKSLSDHERTSRRDAPALLRRGKTLIGGPSVLWEDRILLYGGADTSGTEPDHALWWQRAASLYQHTQDVRAVWRHCLWECAGGWFEVSFHERGTSVDGSLSGCLGGRETTAYGNAQVFSLSGLGSQS